MQSYRHAPIDDQREVQRAFDEVHAFMLRMLDNNLQKVPSDGAREAWKLLVSLEYSRNTWRDECEHLYSVLDNILDCWQQVKSPAGIIWELRKDEPGSLGFFESKFIGMLEILKKKRAKTGLNSD